VVGVGGVVALVWGWHGDVVALGVIGADHLVSVSSVVEPRRQKRTI
jgi:hypothetical protein